MDPLEETWQHTHGHSAHAAPPGEVTLVKGRHTWRFAFTPGDEPAVFACAAAITERASSGLDHYDLAILAYRLGLAAASNTTPDPLA